MFTRIYSAVNSIERLDHFFEQAARFILEKDKDWQKKYKQFLNGDQNHKE